MLLPFDKDNIPYQDSRLSWWQIILYRLLYSVYRSRSEKRGVHGSYNPEPELTSALVEKSLQLKQKIDWNLPLQQSRYVVFDTETTGFYPYQGDEVIAIAGIVVENGVIQKDFIFDELVNPHRKIPQAVVELTGISNEMVADSRGFCSVLMDFLDFVGDSILVAHNAEFDMAFLNIKMNWYTQTEIFNPVIDTFKLSRALYPELNSHDLDTLLKYHKPEQRARHTALGDSLMTAEIFLKFLQQLEEKNIESLKQLYYYLHVKNNIAYST